MNQLNNGSSTAGPSAPPPKASRPPPAPPAGLPNGTVANIHNEFGQPNDCVLLDGLNWVRPLAYLDVHICNRNLV